MPSYMLKAFRERQEQRELSEGFDAPDNAAARKATRDLWPSKAKPQADFACLYDEAGELVWDSDRA